MQVKYQSHFKSPQADKAWFERWVKKLEAQNEREYRRIDVKTSLGKTCVWQTGMDNENAKTLVIFPGARTTSLFWDLDRNLDNIGADVRIFLVETNGLPNLSDGATPDIKTLDYGEWANEVFEKLGVESAFVAGASFGGLIAMKLAITNPARIKAAFLLNPGCLQSFSLAPANLYYNLLPIFSPSEKNVRKFLDKAVFSAPNHRISPEAEQSVVDYELFAIKNYKDKTQKPYYMDEQLADAKAETYLLVGDKDLLFPFQNSIDNARRHLQNLKDVKVFENVGHGIETYAPALKYVGEKIKEIG